MAAGRSAEITRLHQALLAQATLAQHLNPETLAGLVGQGTVPSLKAEQVAPRNDNNGSRERHASTDAQSA